MAKSKLEIVISAKDQASKPLGGIGKALSNIGKVVTAGAIAIGITAIGKAAFHAAEGLARMAQEGAKLQGIEDAFMSMGSSMGIMLKELEAASGGLIKQTDLMSNYNDAALLVSDTFAQKLPEALAYLSKIAAATGQDLNYLLQSFVTGIGRESPMILDNLKIQMGDMEDVVRRWAEANIQAANAMIDHTAAIAENAASIADLEAQLAIAIQKQREFTATTAESTKMAVQRQIDNLRAKIAALKDETAALGDAATFTDEEIQQMIENMDEGTRKMILTEDALKKLKARAAGLPEIVNPIGVMSTALGNFADVVKKVFAKTLLPLLQRIAPLVVDFFDLFGRVIKGDVFEDTFFGVKELPKPLQLVIKLGKDLLDILKAFSERGIQGAISDIAWKLQRAFGDKVYQFIIRMKTGFEKFVDAAKRGLKKVGDFLKVLWKPISEQLLPALGKLAVAIVEAFGGDAGNIAEGFGDILVDIGNFIAEFVIPAIAKFVDWLSTWLPGAIVAVTGFITNKLIPGIRMVVAWFTMNLPKAIAFLKDIWDNELKPMFENFGTWISEKLKPVLEGFSLWLKTNWPIWMESLKTWWAEAWENIKAKATVLWESIKQGISTKFEELKQAMGAKAEEMGALLEQKFGMIKLRLYQKMLQWKSAFISIEWYEVGRAIGQGIVDGLTMMGNVIFETLAGIAQGMLETLMDNLDMGSPSKEFEKLGKLAMLGLANGINMGGAIPILATAKVSGEMLSSVNTRQQGERYSANGITVIYSPGFSAASLQEFQSKLVPLIDQQLNRNQRRRVERAA